MRRAARESPGYAVWGSSSGWLVFYAALGLGAVRRIRNFKVLRGP